MLETVQTKYNNYMIAKELIALMHIKAPADIVDDLRDEFSYHISKKTLYRIWQEFGPTSKPLSAKKRYNCMVTLNENDLRLSNHSESIKEEVVNIILADLYLKFTAANIYETYLEDITRDAFTTMFDVSPLWGFTTIKDTLAYEDCCAEKYYDWEL